ncbi:MAG: NADH-quinone oxidoreductase subunit J [Rivihabitans pingtungensis]
MSFQAFVFYDMLSAICCCRSAVMQPKTHGAAALFLVPGVLPPRATGCCCGRVSAAISLVLVYVGAVMVLFLFVVMMLDIDFEQLREGFWRNLPVAGTVAAIMVAEMVLILTSPESNLNGFKEPAALAADYSNVKDLGRQIYTTYLYPFELAAVLLLLAIVAAIALTMRKRKDTKWVDPAEQVKVRRNDRVRMIQMAAEPRVEDRGGDTNNDNAAA